MRYITMVYQTAAWSAYKYRMTKANQLRSVPDAFRLLPWSLHRRIVNKSTNIIKYSPENGDQWWSVEFLTQDILQQCREWNKPGLLSLKRYMSTSGWLKWGSEDGAWFLYLSDFRMKFSLAGEDCHIPSDHIWWTTSYLASDSDFSQVVSISTLQAQGRGFDPHCGSEIWIRPNNYNSNVGHMQWQLPCLLWDCLNNSNNVSKHCSMDTFYLL